MKDTKIRWANQTWNPMTGCTEISPGCDGCYAKVIAEKFQGGPRSAFPNGFDPTFKPQKLGDPRKWKDSRRVFVNSMSDVHHEDFTDEQIDQVYDVMCDVDRHDFLLLTKRPQRMVRFLLGAAATPDAPGILHPDGYLARRGLDALPGQIWVGTTIESDRYTFRANWLRAIPARIRFLSCEPLIGPVPSLDLDGLHWIIAGGESGNGTKNFRPMEDAWATDLRDRCEAAGVAFYFKQHAAIRTEIGKELEGKLYEEFPLVHPALRVHGAFDTVEPGRHVDAAETPVAVF